MGRNTHTRDAHAQALKMRGVRDSDVTQAGREKVYNTGKLDPLVDPAEYEVIRRSLVRFEERPDKLLELTIGCSIPIETRLDTTGSMGHFVNIAMAALPTLYEQLFEVLPGYDVHVATGIFGDCGDRFVLNRPQFEMEADKIVEQLSLMNPEGNGGGNGGEDPQYGLFGGAYLVAAFANCIGLKRYDFTITDEPAREMLSESQLKRVFGPQVLEKCKTNGFDIDANDLPSTKEVFQDLLKQAHAFIIRVGHRSDAERFWPRVVDPERVIYLSDIHLLTQLQAVVVGLTEGTLALDQVSDFLVESRADKETIKSIQRSVANIPIGAQVPLREAILSSGHEIPKAGDVYREKPNVFKKTNLWPLDPSEVPGLKGDTVTVPDDTAEDDGPTWL